MFKIDTHIHTCETSHCGQIFASQIVERYKNAGYDGIVITDHYSPFTFTFLEGQNWEEKIGNYLLGYKNALNAGKNYGLTVLLGMELTFTENHNDYLIFGIDEEFLMQNPMLHLYSLVEFRKLADKNNLLIYQAHPFRPSMQPMPKGMIDGCEVYNGNPRHDSRNDLAFNYAQKNGLKMLSGSDCHQIGDVARGGIIIKNPVSTAKELTEVLKNGDIELIIK